MPAVVSKSPDTFAPGIGALGALAAGKTAGMQYNEGVRQFNEQMKDKVRNTDIDQQKANDNREIAFRELQLRKQEGRLNREQEARLAVIEDKRARDLTAQQLATEASIASANNATEKYKADKQASVQLTQLADQRNQLQSTSRSLDIMEGVLAGVDPANMTQEQRDAAVERAIESDLGIDRVRGGNGVIQAKPEEVEARRQYYQQMLQNFPEMKAKLRDEQLYLMQEEARYRATGEGTGNSYDATVNMPLTYIGAKGDQPGQPENLHGMTREEVNAHFAATGTYPIDTSKLSAQDRETYSDFQIMLEDVAEAGQAGNLDVIVSGPNSYVQQVIKMPWQNSQLRSYALAQVNNIASTYDQGAGGGNQAFEAEGN